MIKILSLIILISFILLPAILLANEPASIEPIPLQLNYPEFGGIDLNTDQNLNELIAWFYYFIVGIAGLAAFIMLVWGGFQWLTSAGNPTKLADAKERIFSALLGLLIILGSWLILQVINPELTILKLPGLP